MKIKDLQLVEIELFNYCNRTCGWCPNSYIDRKSEKKYLDFDIFTVLLQELKEKDFEGVISFSRFNEPFADIQRMAMGYIAVKHILPHVKMVANTNGDFDYSWFKNRMEITEMDYDHTKKETTKDNFRVMRLENVNNRGGALDIKQDFKRDFPCYEPQQFIGVNYDGTVSPCCNIRNDIKKHKPFIVGDLHESNLEQMLRQLHVQNFRERASWGKYEYLPLPCKSCDKQSGRYTSGNGIGGKQT